eukprot:gnl/TRDRNA2_/TRDRNA2_111028_c2_seq1.p1 gnl/TRDRNA2_/TRDRNA2_111028_c2~~gnl/TRDRNA2_/TRDRNA2_111028_c2_seq1.p1  ORF type:complete len:304 (+),score=47.64 gnl/TRDRNA2_/TRDRNA2_111028_c2_seq1:61-912(+)
MEREAGGMAMADIARCMESFRRVALHFPTAVQAGLAVCVLPLRRAWLLRERVEGARAADVATVLECSAYFAVENAELQEVALNYLTDRVDEISERSAINAAYAMCATGASGTHSHLLSLLFRRIGSGTAWERQRVRVFQLWICQRLQFPWLDARLPRRCVNEGLRAWCLHRRGYGSPFPDEVRAVSAELQAMGVAHRTFVPVKDSPYEVDLAVGERKDALLVVSETARNTFEPVGNALLQLRHLRACGWCVVLVPRRVWQGVAAADAEARRSYLRSLLEAFEV